MAFVRSVFGVPNTQGSFRAYSHINSVESEGVFYSEGINMTAGLSSGTEFGGVTRRFDASIVSSVYVNSGTVRPKSLSVLVLLRL